MATLANLRTDIRSRLVEATADFFSDAELDRWTNQGYKRFIALTDWTEKVVAYPLVANQYEYTIPSDCKKINMVQFADKYPVQWVDLEEFRAFAGFADATSDRPYMYRIYPWDGKIRVYPIPSAASASTTLVGAHNSSVTTLALTDASNFPSRGRITLGTEQILYYAKSGNSLTQCVRGDGYTTAGTYVGAEAVTYAPLEVYLTYQPPDLATGVDTRIGPSYEEALINYTCHIAMLKKDKYEVASMYRKLFDELTQKAIEERERQQRDRLWAIKDADDFYGNY